MTTTITIKLSPKEQSDIPGALNDWRQFPGKHRRVLVIDLDQMPDREADLRRQFGMDVPSQPVGDPGDEYLRFYCAKGWWRRKIEPAYSRWDGMYSGDQINVYEMYHVIQIAQSLGQAVTGEDGAGGITDNAKLLEQVQKWIANSPADPNLPWALAYVARGGGYYDASGIYRQ